MAVAAPSRRTDGRARRALRRPGGHRGQTRRRPARGSAPAHRRPTDRPVTAHCSVSLQHRRRSAVSSAPSVSRSGHCHTAHQVAGVDSGELTPAATDCRPYRRRASPAPFQLAGRPRADRLRRATARVSGRRLTDCGGRPPSGPTRLVTLVNS